jgi:Protein of unknown function (DUF3108)
MPAMLRSGASLLAFLPCAALAQAPVSLHASYDTYAAGLHVAEVEGGVSIGPWSYQLSLGWHTTGVVGLFLRGHQFDVVNGSWQGQRAVPTRFLGEGLWHGEDRRTEIDYQQDKPIIRQLLPPNATEREAVPDSLQANTIDTLSALADLIRIVELTGRCERTVNTFDGRRAIEIEAHTVGQETLGPTSRSSFAGKALRCDFSGRMLAGFKFDDDRVRDSRSMHGSAWLAPVVAGGPPFPVHMTFETKWFGDATMYLTGVGPGSDVRIARGN